HHQPGGLETGDHHFFFRAEDGIRDFHVTGVQTCALPISGAEWFDTSTYPTARFEATAFKALGGNRYEATGTLRIKTTTVPVVLRSEERRVGQADGTRRRREPRQSRARTQPTEQCLE